MTNAVLEQWLVELVGDIEVAISNINEKRDLQDMVYQTSKAVKYLADEKERTSDSYFALIDIVKEVDKYSNMDLRYSFFNFDKKIDDPEMQAKFTVLITNMIDQLYFKMNSLRQPTVLNHYHTL